MNALVHGQIANISKPNLVAIPVEVVMWLDVTLTDAVMVDLDLEIIHFTFKNVSHKLRGRHNCSGVLDDSFCGCEPVVNKSPWQFVAEFVAILTESRAGAECVRGGCQNDLRAQQMKIGEGQDIGYVQLPGGKDKGIDTY